MSIIDGVVKVFGKKTPEVSPATIAGINRDSGEAIAGTLRSINFSRLKAQAEAGKLDQKTYDRIINKVNACKAKLLTAPTIFDNIKEVDAILEKAADTLKSAVERQDPLPYLDQAECCVNAICEGLLFQRDNIPAQFAKDRDSILKKRAEYMEKHDFLIHTYGQIAENREAQEKNSKAIEELAKEYEPLRAEILEMAGTKEGRVKLGRVRESEADGKLNVADQKLALKLNRTGDLARQLRLMRIQELKFETEAQTLASQAVSFRTALAEKPRYYQDNLEGEYAAILDEISESAAAVLTRANAMRELQEKKIAEMNKILEEANRTLIGTAVEAMDEILSPELDDTLRGMNAADQIQRRMDEQKQMAEEAEKELNELMEEEPEKVVDFAEEENTEAETVQNDNAAYDLNS